MLVVDAYNYSIRAIADILCTLGNDPAFDAMDDYGLADELTRNWLLEPLEWNTTRQRQYDRDVLVAASSLDRTNPRSSPVRRLFLPVVPKKCNPKVLTLRPERGWTQRGPDIAPAAAYDERESVIVLRGTKDDLNNFLGTAETIVKLVNGDIDKYYRDFFSTVLRMIQARRGELAREEESFKNEARELGVEIRNEPDAPLLINVRERAEIRILREPSPRANGSADPRLTSDSIARIVDLIDQCGRGIEGAPRHFRKLGEGGLRHVIVVNLNTALHSTDVTGETFSKHGRPDLVIIRDGHPVLVGECKFWRGKSLYGKTLGEQLVRYITWRHTDAVFITFADSNNLSRIVREAREETLNHPQTVERSVHDRSDTYFKSRLNHPDDPEKEVEIHHLFFNLYSALDE